MPPVMLPDLAAPPRSSRARPGLQRKTVGPSGNLSSSRRVQRAAIFGQPPDLDGFTRAESCVAGRVRHFDNKVIVSAHIDPGADVIAKINQFLDFATDKVRDAARLRVDRHSFGA